MLSKTLVSDYFNGEKFDTDIPISVFQVQPSHWNAFEASISLISKWNEKKPY